jgi:O-antigen/teichoic acid export membrane protein
MKKQIVANIASHNLGKGFEMLLGMLLVPFLINKLGAKGFGLIVLAESLVRFSDFSVSGLRIALGRYVGVAISRKEYSMANEYLSTGSLLLIVLVCILASLSALVLLKLTDLFSIPDDFVNQARPFMLMMMMAFLIHVWFVPVWSVLYAYQRFDLTNLYIACRNIFRSLSCFLVYLIFPPALYYYGIIYLSAVIIEQALIVRGARRLFPDLNISLRKFSRRHLGTLFSFMSMRTLQSVTSILYTDTHVVFINRFMGAAATSVYLVSLKFSDVLQRIIQHSLWVVVPSYTQLLSQGEHDRLRNLIGSLSKASALISLPLGALLLLFGRDLIILWVGPEFVDAVEPMYFNVLYVIPILIFTPAASTFTAYARMKVPSLVSVTSAVLNIGVGLFCAFVLDWGVRGFAFGSFMASCVHYGLFVPYYSCRITGDDYVKYLSSVLVWPVILTLLFIAIPVYMRFALGLSLVFQAAGVAVGGLLYFVIAYHYAFDERERRIMKYMFEKIIARIGERIPSLRLRKKYVKEVAE